MEEYTSGAYPLVLHADADPDTLGGTAICGFSTVGSVGVIATSHLIKTLELSPMGTVMHPKFPAIALIHDSIPKHPLAILMPIRPPLTLPRFVLPKRKKKLTLKDLLI